MTEKEVNIVWLKRDLRSQDHKPLYAAEQIDLPYLIIYLFEPSIMQHQDTSLRHLQFVYNSLQSLNKTFETYNASVKIFYGEAIDIFTYLQKRFKLNHIFSYQESGTSITWERDKKVKAFCATNGIAWKQYQRDGIIRGIKNRIDWNKRWGKVMHEPIIQNTYSTEKMAKMEHSYDLPIALEQSLKDYPSLYQPAGEENAWRYLRSFAEGRGANYQKHISKPLLSRKSCSRISPYLAWGNLSVKQAFQFIGTHPNGRKNNHAFSAMLTRLHWHCHFIQKFEVECRYETHCINSGYELLEHETNETFIAAWKTGQTGYPLLDACMRAVKETGWINFRMRAMLVSFFCFNLDQDWRDGVYHLAQQFLDYEPGIHYPQFQMQAGTTGINTVRLYNPTKNAQEHDEDGLFIKKWIPELANVPISHIHEPWLMTLMEQQFCGVIIGKDYPFPIVDLQKSANVARTKIWEHKKHPSVIKEKNRLLHTHVNITHNTGH